MTPEALTTAICSRLDEALRDNLAIQLRSSRRGWTSGIRKALSDLGRELGFQIAPSDDEGAFLYDMVWYSIDEPGFLLDLKMAMECENEIAPIGCVDFDFQKLVQSRADIRIWISTSANKNDTQIHIMNCKKQIDLFRAGQPGDRYIFLFFEWGPVPSHSLEVFEHRPSSRP